MIPNVAHHLKCMKKTLNDVIMPRVSDDAFATEQTALMVAMLQLLLDVHDKEYPYEYYEHVEYENMLSALEEKLRNLSVIEASGDLAELFMRAKEIVDARKSASKGGLPSYESLRAGCIEQKHLVRRLLEDQRVTEDDAVWRECGSIVDDVMARQLQRELSWQRLTGFDPSADRVPALGDLLFGSDGAMRFRNR